jgi:hypothetical protein
MATHSNDPSTPPDSEGQAAPSARYGWATVCAAAFPFVLLFVPYGREGASSSEGAGMVSAMLGGGAGNSRWCMFAADLWHSPFYSEKPIESILHLPFLILYLGLLFSPLIQLTSLQARTRSSGVRAASVLLGALGLPAFAYAEFWLGHRFFYEIMLTPVYYLLLAWLFFASLLNFGMNFEAFRGDVRKMLNLRLREDSQGRSAATRGR